MSKIKKVSYDFSMDSMVSVDAPIGTNPESLTKQALDKFMQKIKDDDVELTFEALFDIENGAYDDDWENYKNNEKEQ